MYYYLGQLPFNANYVRDPLQCQKKMMIVRDVGFGDLITLRGKTFSISPTQDFCFEWKFAIFGTKYWVGESQSSLFHFKIIKLQKYHLKSFNVAIMKITQRHATKGKSLFAKGWPYFDLDF